MEKIIQEPTYVSIKDSEGKPCMARSLLGSGAKIVYDEETGLIDVFNDSGVRVWHSKVQDAKIEIEGDEQ